MRRPRDDHRANRKQHTTRHYPGHAADRGDVAIEQNHGQHAGSRGDQVHEPHIAAKHRHIQHRPEICPVIRKPDAARRNCRRAEAELPDVEKGNPAARAVAPVHLAQKGI